MEWTQTENGRLNTINCIFPFFYNLVLSPIDTRFEEDDIENFSGAPIVFDYNGYGAGTKLPGLHCGLLIGLG